MKKYFNLLIYLSLLFLIIFIVKYNYFDIKDIKFSYLYLFLSILFLWLGFIINTLCWGKYLSLNNIKVPNKLSIPSHGLSIFSKYIPGKFWVIFGRAMYISNLGFPLSKVSILSFKAQILTVLTGLIISTIPLLIFHTINKYYIVSLIIAIFLFGFSFNKKIHNIIIIIIYKIIRKKIEIPYINLSKSLGTLKYFFFYWFLIIIAFYFFSKSLYTETPFLVGFSFPIALSIGILTIIFPGGLGVREGFLTGMLVLFHIPFKNAISISIISRLWFLSAEIFIFFFSLIIHKINKKLENSRRDNDSIKKYKK